MKLTQGKSNFINYSLTIIDFRHYISDIGVSVYNAQDREPSLVSSLQVNGTLNGEKGVFEYIVDELGRVCHETFKAGGVINGKPN